MSGMFCYGHGNDTSLKVKGYKIGGRLLISTDKDEQAFATFFDTNVPIGSAIGQFLQSTKKKNQSSNQSLLCGSLIKEMHLSSLL